MGKLIKEENQYIIKEKKKIQHEKKKMLTKSKIDKENNVQKINVINFENMGRICFHAKKFPEATFWFFQHKIHVLNCKSYDNVHIANSHCTKIWNDFSTF